MWYEILKQAIIFGCASGGAYLTWWIYSMKLKVPRDGDEVGVLVGIMTHVMLTVLFGARLLSVVLFASALAAFVFM